MEPMDIRASQWNGVHCTMEPRPSRNLSAGLKITVALMLLVGAAASNAQDEKFSAIQVTPTLRRHVMLPSRSARNQSVQPAKPQLKLAPQSLLKSNVSGSGAGVVYTCDANVAASTCNYLNTTVAGYYNAIFTNANASIYVQYGTTGLGESTGYLNLVPYSQYITAVTKTTPRSSIQVSALSSFNTYAATPYGSGNVEVTVALGSALGFSGLMGVTPALALCTPGTSGCYAEIVTVADAASQASEGITLYYDDQGGTEGPSQYDFYAVVQHETDEVLGTSSCISTDSSSLSDDCDFSGGTGVPSVVDLMRYSSPGSLAVDTAPSTTAGQYFSYDGGAHYGAYGPAATNAAKVYNTLDDGQDFSDYIPSSPDCGTNEAIQDATGCPGEDAGLTVLNDGLSEFQILNADGFSTPEAVIATPAPGSSLGGSSVTFQWNAATGATAYELYVGSTGVGSNDIFQSSAAITGTSQAVTGIPTSGTVYARVWSYIGGVFWTSTDLTFKGSTSSGTPVVKISPTTLAFGSVTDGTISAAQTITVTNTGNGILNISTIGFLGGAGSLEFAITKNTCGSTLAAGANCTFGVLFEPGSSPGTYGAEVGVTDNAAGSPQYATISGTGVAGGTGTVTLSPTSLTFPATTVGASSAPQHVALTNTGTTAVTITSIALTGINSTSFYFINGCSSSLAASANCVVSVYFSPATTGSQVAGLTYTDSAAGSPQTVSLTGTGLASGTGTVSLTATSLNFGSVLVGSSSNSQYVTMTNTGTTAVTIASVALTGANASQFVFGNTCGTSLAAGANCSIHGHFAPTANGAMTGAITITDSATGSPQSITLAGTGYSPTSVTLSATSLNFGSVAVGSTSSSQSVTMTNTGSAALSITSIALTGANASSFVFANSCGTSLAAGANCSIHGHFAPTITGALTAAITISDSAAGSPQTISISGTGTGTAGPLTMTPASLTFAPTNVGSVSPGQVVTISNTTASAIAITGISFTGTNTTSFTTLETCTASLPANSSCTAMVSFLPQTTGALTSALRITSSAGNASTALSGTGIATAALTFSTTSLPFPTTTHGTQSLASIITVTNTGTTTAEFGFIGIGGTNYAEFYQLNSCGTSLAAGATCKFYVIFRPAAASTAYTATLELFDNAQSGYQGITLSGTGN